MKIKNFLPISEGIASCGQPSEENFSAIASRGYHTVINLALATSDHAIPAEGDLVTRLGMSYVHIPIQWEYPTQDQFAMFVAIMRQQVNKKVLVHCALNMRASVFLYLYSTIYLNISEQNALKKLNQVWEPNQIWSEFITKVKNSVK